MSNGEAPIAHIALRPLDDYEGAIHYRDPFVPKAAVEETYADLAPSQGGEALCRRDLDLLHLVYLLTRLIGGNGFPVDTESTRSWHERRRRAPARILPCAE